MPSDYRPSTIGDRRSSLADEFAAAPSRTRVTAFDGCLLASTAAAHFINDFYVAFLAPLLPLIVARFHLSLTLAGLLASILNTSTSITQPLFGALADRMRHRFLVIVGPMLTTAAMGLMGLAPSYSALIVLLLIAGTGTASFHPQGASTAGVASGVRKGIGLSVFVAGGELGYSLGPLIIALVVAVYGLASTWVVALPGLIACVALWWLVVPHPAVRSEQASNLGADLRKALRPLMLLWLIVVLRSVIILSYITFVPLLLRERGGSVVAGGAAVFLFGGIGAVGGLLGGAISDRIGRRLVLALSLMLGAPLLLTFVRSQALWGYAFLAAGGISIYLSAAVTIVMAQELLPQRASVASSIVMGLAWGVAGLSLTAVGALADTIGLPEALSTILALAAVALVTVAVLPKGGAVVAR